VKPILAPLEYDSSQMVDGEYIRASLGYDGFAFLEGFIQISVLLHKRKQQI
jgi:hypothetical protein